MIAIVGWPSRRRTRWQGTEKDHQVPWGLANASCKRQKHSSGITEIVEISGRGHALTIDSGWREVADEPLKFIERFNTAS